MHKIVDIPVVLLKQMPMEQTASQIVEIQLLQFIHKVIRRLSMFLRCCWQKNWSCNRHVGCLQWTCPFLSSRKRSMKSKKFSLWSGFQRTDDGELLGGREGHSMRHSRVDAWNASVCKYGNKFALHSSRSKLFRFRNSESEVQGQGEPELLLHRDTRKVWIQPRHAETMKNVDKFYVVNGAQYFDLKSLLDIEKCWVWFVFDCADREIRVWTEQGAERAFEIYISRVGRKGRIWRDEKNASFYKSLWGDCEDFLCVWRTRSTLRRSCMWCKIGGCHERGVSSC